MKKIAQNLFNSLGYRISKYRQPIEYPFIDVLDLLVQKYMKDKPYFFIVQIGASDGVTADPITHLIKQYHWAGVLIEPQPIMFEKLVENYRDESQLIFENALISDKEGMTTFYAVPDRGENFHCWVYQAASQDRNVALRSLEYWKYKRKDPNIPDDYESLIKEFHIPSLTVNSLINKHQIKNIDLLVIDTMGYDFKIIKMFPFTVIKPAIIHFEHKLLSFDEQADCCRYLIELGYSLTRVDVDTIAYLHAPTRNGLHSLSYP